MLTRGLFLLIFVMAAATNFLAGASTARAADVSCSGTLGGNTYPATVTDINGNVNVPDHASCTLYFVNVTGNVKVGHGSTLVIDGYNEPSTIGGNVQATQCTSALLEGNVTVGGNVQIQQCTGTGPNGFQGPDIVINGNFECQGNSSNASACLAWLGKVQGDVQIQQNTSVTASDVSLVDIGGNLHCEFECADTDPYAWTGLGERPERPRTGCRASMRRLFDHEDVDRHAGYASCVLR